VLVIDDIDTDVQIVLPDQKCHGAFPALFNWGRL